MKKTIGILLFIQIGLIGFSQEILRDPATELNMNVQQIIISGLDQLLQQQLLNQGFNNYTLTQQAGTGNKAHITQYNDQNTPQTNQSTTFQSGISNELTIGQIGNGNTILGFQLGYISNINGVVAENLFAPYPGISFFESGSTDQTTTTEAGERNRLNISQEGTNNGILTIQQGNDNNVEMAQKGRNNYLMVLQNGIFNSATGYLQGNNSDLNLYESIIQNGDHLSFTSSDVSRSKVTGNSIFQSGTNLSLQFNNEFINTIGGVEITQTGNDMNVIVDQSYFFSQ